MLSTGEVQRRLREAFDFQSATIASPPETFGPVPRTSPPGLVFGVGAMSDPDGKLVPIRFLHFEAQRIVIDAAGPSATLDLAWQKILSVVREVRAPDDTATIGEPVRQLDHSQVTFHATFAPRKLLGTALQGLISDIFPNGGDSDELTIAPTVLFHVTNRTGAYADSGSHGIFRLELRAGERTDANIYYSSAPLPSELHISYLSQLEAKAASAIG